MISICIPVYNFDMTNLVRDLMDQISGEMEVILIDDASDGFYKEKNRKIVGKNFKYIELESNIGRSKIRNLFLKYAQNDFLLFLDCDSEIVSENYIKQYIDRINDSTQLIFGGSIYSADCPSANQVLRWKYGLQKESKSAEIRKINPNKSFMTNNFLIKKQLLHEVPFDERITKYGHEDTILGIEMGNKGVSIDHIQNPVLNSDIDTNAVFLSKTEASLENLVSIYSFYENKEQLIDSIALLRVVNRINTFKLGWIFRLMFILFGNSFKNHLLNSKNPSLQIFNLYKLVYFFHHQYRKNL